MKKQLQAIEAEISHIPEIREFINQQHGALKHNEKHLKLQKRVHELEKKQLQAEEEIQHARNKLHEACNYNLDLKDKLIEYQNKLRNAEGEIDRLIDAGNQQLAAHKKAKGNAPAVLNKQAPKPTNHSKPDPTSPLNKNKAGTKPTGRDSHINVKSPHILSMMEVREAFIYKGKTYRIPEIAYQTSKATFIMGNNSPEASHIYSLTEGKVAKKYAQEHLPHSEKWQKMKTEAIRNILRAVMRQDPLFREALMATGDREIRHTVADTYWGTGGASRSEGSNVYGEILMELRSELLSADYNQSQQDPKTEDKFSIHLNKGTECLLITDSQCKHVNAKFLFGSKKVHVQKCPTAVSMETFSAELANGPLKPHVTHIVINNGINDVRDGKDTNATFNAQVQSIEALKRACPNANIHYCMPLSKSTNENVESLGHKMRGYSIDNNITFIKHDIPTSHFTDEYHISSEGTRIYVSRLHWYARRAQLSSQNEHQPRTPPRDTGPWSPRNSPHHQQYERQPGHRQYTRQPDHWQYERQPDHRQYERQPDHRQYDRQPDHRQYGRQPNHWHYEHQPDHRQYERQSDQRQYERQQDQRQYERQLDHQHYERQPAHFINAPWRRNRQPTGLPHGEHCCQEKHGSFYGSTPSHY